MNKKTYLVFLLAITAVSHSNFCMEINKYKQPLIIKPSKNYKELKHALQKKIIDNHSTVAPDKQYEILKTCIENNDLISLKVCLDCKFSPNRYHMGISLLHYAIKHNNSEALWLLSYAKPDLVPLKSSIPLNDLEETPLDYAVRLDYRECIIAMSQIIERQCYYLFIYKQHCGLTKHILEQTRPCQRCITELSQQLHWHHDNIISCNNNATNANADIHS